MAKQEKIDRHLRCSFCGKSRDEVRKLIAGPTVYICDECVNLCNDIIAEDWEEAKEEISSKLRKPAEIKHHLDQYVIGQDRAKKILVRRRAQSLQAHLRRMMSTKSSFKRAISWSSVRPAQARPCWLKPWHDIWMSRLRWPMPRPSQKPAMWVKMLKISSSSCCKPLITMSNALNAASSTSMKSTRSAEKATVPRSPATCRAKACSRRCSNSSKERWPMFPRKAGASIRIRNSSR